MDERLRATPFPLQIRPRRRGGNGVWGIAFVLVVVLGVGVLATITYFS